MKHDFLLLCLLLSGVAVTAEPVSYVKMIEDRDGEECGYINHRQNMIIPFGAAALCYSPVRTFINREQGGSTDYETILGPTAYALVSFKNKPGIWSVNPDGEVLYEVKFFDNGPDYGSNGLFRIIKDGKIGYADFTTGEVVIEPQFGCAYPFDDAGRAKVGLTCQTETDGEYSRWVTDKWFFIDKEGRVITDK